MLQHIVVFTSGILLLCLFKVSSFEHKKKKCVMTTSTNFTIVSKVEAFVDKTMLIKTLLEGGDFQLITAPRRFGKSTNINMLQSFISIPVNENGNKTNPNNTAMHELFKNLMLFQREPILFYTYFGKFPVLYLDLKVGDPINTCEQAIKIFKYKVHEVFKSYSYLCKSIHLDTEERRTCESWCSVRYDDLEHGETNRGLVNLAKYLFKHFENTQVFVLVDEYETLVTAAVFMADDDDLSGIVKLIAGQLERLMTSQYVGRAVVAGVSALPGLAITKPKNLVRYRFLGNHALVNYFGFTDDEVKQLFQRDVFNLDPEEVIKAHKMYGGFTSAGGSTMYSAGSVLQFLWKGKAEAYWPPSIYVEHIMNAYNLRPVEKAVDKLLKDKSVEISFQSKIDIDDFLDLTEMFSRNINSNLKPNVDLFLLHIMELGHLSIDVTRRREPKRLYVKLANHEMKQTLLEYIWNIQVFSKLNH